MNKKYLSIKMNEFYKIILYSIKYINTFGLEYWFNLTF